jgi:hypothetical protein
MKQAGLLQREYQDIIRGLVVTDDAVREAADEIVKEWIGQVVPEESFAQAA